LNLIAKKIIEKFPSRIILITYDDTCTEHDLRTSVSVLTTDEGENEIVAYVEDDHGLTSQDTITVVYDPTLPADNQPPTLSITTPADGLVLPVALTGVFDVVGIVSDNVGIKSLKVRVEPNMAAEWNVKVEDIIP
jgi:hypothetical protein